MSVSASTQIPKTSDDAVFQRQCKVLFEHILHDPNIEEFGTSGQGQKGIDLLGRRRNRSLDHWVGIQCKLTIKAKKLKGGKKGVVETEATSALTFEPALKELIIATTAPNDGALQAEAARFTDQQAKLGRDFTVQVWGWETLSAYIPRYEAALKAFMPDAFPQLDRVTRGQEKLLEDFSTVAAKQDSFAAEQSSMHAMLVRIVGRQMSSDIARQAVWDDRSVDTLIDRQIDRLRDMINEGRPRTAQGLLETLWSDLPTGAEGRIRFRVKSNIAACLLRLGDEQKAADTYLEAYEYCPTDPKAVALKVLALLLLKQPGEALAFGRRAYIGSVEQGSLVAHMIAAAKSLPDENDPLRFITDNVADDPTVAIAKIDYLRSKQESDAWWEYAKDRHARHPDNEILARSAAEADIDRAAKWAETNDRRPLNQELRTKVIEAIAILEQQRSKHLSSESAWDDYRVSLSVNLALAYRLLRRHSEAKDVVELALHHVPNDVVLNQALLTISLESGDYSAARRALVALPDSRDVIVAQLQILASKGDWSKIVAKYSSIDREDLDPEDKALVESVVLLAKGKLGQVLEPKVASQALIGLHPKQPIVPTVLYELAVHLRDGLWATELYQAAIKARENANSATRVMLAKIAEREEDGESVIELLHGYIDPTQDSEELRSLARAFVNSAVRQASLSFIDDLPPELASQAFFARVIGSIHFNRGDLPSAALHFERALLADQTEVAAHLGLINTWLRQNKRDLVREHLRLLEFRGLRGPSAQMVGLAQILVAFDEKERGLALGYDIAVKNRTDQRTVMLYIGLILPDTTGALIPPTLSTVGIDCWVSAKRSDGHILDFVIEDRKDRNDPAHFSADHPLSQLFLGKSKGDLVVSTPALGTEENWCVVDFKHKYLALLHEFIETLPSRFPDAKGFYRFEGDTSSFLAEVKRLGEQDEQILDHYLKDGYPLALVAGFRGKSSVELAGHVIGRGAMIRCCLGNVEERNAAVRVIGAARNRGIVLDTYTAWVAQQLKLLGVFKKTFARVAICQTAIDELLQWQKRMEPQGDEPMMTVGYCNGQHFREEIPAERLRESVAKIARGIEEISKELEIVPAVAPARPSVEEEKLTEIGPHGFLDPIYVSATEELLLVSDDLSYRAIAQELHGREGVWLQAVLAVALAIRAIDVDGYVDATYGLTAQKHNHTTLTAANLMNLVGRDPAVGLEKLAVSAAFIGNETAEPTSHVKVAFEFMVQAWNSDLPFTVKAKAISIVLERLAEMLSRLGMLKETMQDMLQASRPADLRQYLQSWVRGHFLDLN